MRVTEVRRADVQDYVDRLRKNGLSASTIANKLDPIRVIFRRALQRDEMSVDPTEGLVLPAVRGRRERIADRAEAATLIAALPDGERAFWAVAIYGGLRRGELRALRWTDVDLDAEPAVIHVRRTWDDVEGEVEVKTEAGYGVVPLTEYLRQLLVAHRASTRRGSRVRPDGGRSVHPLYRADPCSPSVGVEGSAEPRAGRAEDHLGQSPARRPRAHRTA
jgi:integrase